MMAYVARRSQVQPKSCAAKALKSPVSSLLRYLFEWPINVKRLENCAFRGDSDSGGVHWLRGVGGRHNVVLMHHQRLHHSRRNPGAHPTKSVEVNEGSRPSNMSWMS